MRGTNRLLIVASAVLAFAAGIAAAAAGGSAAANRAAVRADAAKLLATVSLPPGATRSSGEPAGDGSVLARPSTSPGTANLVDRHQWWTVPGSPRSVLDYVKHHHPAGSRLLFSGSSAGPNKPEERDLGFDWAPVPGVLGVRQLLVTVVALPHHVTGLRVDAQDVWVTPRPTSEQIPSSVARLRLIVTKGKHRLQGPLVFVSRSKLDAVITLLNELPLFPPGVYSCPSDWGTRIRLAFFDAAATEPAAVASVDPGGCRGVALELDGRRQPELASGPIPGHPHATLIGLLEKDLGVRIREGIPR